MAEDEKPAKPARPEKAGADGAKAPRAAKGGDKARPEKTGKGDKGAPKGKGDPGAKAAPKAEKAARVPRPKDYRPRLKSHYEKVVREEMAKQFAYKNPMQIPRVEKVVLNMGIGEAVNDRKKVDSAAKDLALIAGQRPVITRARKSIATYKLRDGMPIGAKVTLRGDRMYEFLDRLVSIALPRVRDFKGLSVDAFDGRGNYTMGLKDQLIFPEIDFAKVDKARGMNLTFVTTARSDDEARSLLSHLGLPFRKN